MAAKHQPVRSCRACRKKRAKTQLTRWVLVDGKVVKDQSQHLDGRGAYTCSEACYDKIQKQLPYLLKVKTPA